MRRLMFALVLCSLPALIVGCDPSTSSNGTRDAAARDGQPTTRDQADKDGSPALAKDQATGKDGPTVTSKDGKGLPIDKDAEWLKPEDRQTLFMDFNMTDHEGKAFNLKETLGKPTVATFVFTRCPNPQMCPLQAKKMAWLQQKLEKANLGDKINLLLISFDPDYDTPERLKKFGQENGVEFTNARMLRPAVPEFREFIDEFPIRVGYSTSGEVNHKTDLFMLDHKGGVARMYYGMWNDTKVLEEVQRLVDEANSPKVAPPDGPAKDAPAKEPVKDATN